MSFTEAQINQILEGVSFAQLDIRMNEHPRRGTYAQVWQSIQTGGYTNLNYTIYNDHWAMSGKPFIPYLSDVRTLAHSTLEIVYIVVLEGRTTYTDEDARRAVMRRDMRNIEDLLEVATLMMQGLEGDWEDERWGREHGLI